MGTQDSAKYVLACPECGRTEEAVARDHGSGWGPDNWSLPRFSLFEATVTGGGAEVPAVTAACLACQVTATVESRFGIY